MHLANSNNAHLPNILSAHDIHNIRTNKVIKKSNTDDLYDTHKQNIIGQENIKLEYKNISYKDSNDGKQCISKIRNKWYNPVSNCNNK